jgi:ubiquinone/menaquinone biosynthesis C-methylase UbiE
MSTPTNPRPEHPSTYFVEDRSSEKELSRLQLQDQMLTRGMGGVLPEQPDPTIFEPVLDIGCGTGSWLIETARTYPTMSLLIGVDVSSKMIEYACAQAEAQQESRHVQFRTMDALRMLEFPPDSFDLVNQRLGGSYLRTWDWPKLLQEYRRVSRPGGIIRITECALPQNNTPALTSLNSLCLRALSQAGHYFIPGESNGLIDELVPLLERHGFQNVHSRLHRLELRAGTEEGHIYSEDVKYLFRTLVPFLRKWTHVPKDYEVIYRQALVEMQQPDFVATWNLLTV